jgi:hypothetical protein
MLGSVDGKFAQSEEWERRKKTKKQKTTTTKGRENSN